MKHKLSFREYVYVASMLFGMFFGAGNLIFPVYMGQVAGWNVWPAIVGFLVTGVGLPLLGVAALGISRSRWGSAGRRQRGAWGRGERQGVSMVVSFQEKARFKNSNRNHSTAASQVQVAVGVYTN